MIGWYQTLAPIIYFVTGANVVKTRRVTKASGSRISAISNLQRRPNTDVTIELALILCLLALPARENLPPALDKLRDT